jgi:chemotaxis protein MotA
MIDVQTLIGLGVAVLAVVGGVMLEGGSPGSLVHGGAFLIVIGGTVAAILVQTPGRVSLRALRMLAWLVRPPASDRAALIQRLVHWSRIARRDGLLALERPLASERDPFARTGLAMLIDGYDAEALRTGLETELTTREDSGMQGARVFESAGGYAPTLGILGAVLGLIQVMGNLDDPAGLGAGIATAFVATVYGLAAANLLLLPVANKLKHHVRDQIRDKELLIDGLVAIAAGANPRTLERQLHGHLE